jgi:hypothetical protein
VKDGIPWFEWTLRETVRRNIAQFRTGRPTFLVYVIHDLWILDIETAISKVLQDGPTEFPEIAGIMVDDFERWHFKANESPRYDELKSAGLFDAIAKLGQH